MGMGEGGNTGAGWKGTEWDSLGPGFYQFQSDLCFRLADGMKPDRPQLTSPSRVWREADSPCSLPLSHHLALNFRRKRVSRFKLSAPLTCLLFPDWIVCRVYPFSSQFNWLFIRGVRLICFFIYSKIICLVQMTCVVQNRE